jgi:hypothetical protein
MYYLHNAPTYAYTDSCGVLMMHSALLSEALFLHFNHYIMYQMPAIACTDCMRIVDTAYV